MTLPPPGRAALESRVRRVAERVSGRPVVDMAAPLFDQGWDSLDAVELEVELENEFGVAVCCDAEDVTAVSLDQVVGLMARALAGGVSHHAPIPLREGAPA